MNFGSTYTVVPVRYPAWKTKQTELGFAAQYGEDDQMYTVYGYSGPEIFVCTLWKSAVPYSAGYPQEDNDADLADFEATYK